MKHLLNITDYSTEELQAIIDKAVFIISDPWAYNHSCEGKKLATLFFEPSTRTRLSFEAAMLELGGRVISVTGPGGSSVTKGETLADTARTVSCYADVIAVRHPLAGSARAMANSSAIPIINAGDGGHYHPTQTLADLLTVYREKGKLGGLRIGICGDLLYGRTVHSLIDAMSRYEGNSFVLISPKELMVPPYYTEKLTEMGIPFVQTDSLDEAIPEIDMLYMTRIQRERFEDPAEYERLAGRYILDAARMKGASKDCIVLHPLPRVDEISTDFDDDPRAVYFTQAYNGKIMRKALILKLLAGKEHPDNTDISPEGEKLFRDDTLFCTNSRCVCTHERGIRKEFYTDRHGTIRCAYCDQPVKTADR